MKASVTASLLSLSQQSGSGLEEEDHSDLTERLLGIHRSGNNWQIQVGSDGLNLNHKIFIEQYILSRLGENYPEDSVLVYFKKLRPEPTPSGNTGPTPVPTREQAFGINVRRKHIPGVRQIIAVASGKGGVGKSTVSTNLAVALANQGKKVGLLDADIYGPSGPMMLGARGPASVDENGKLIPLEQFGVRLMSFGFLSDAMNPVLWRGPLAGKAIEQLCYDVAWGELDLLVLDLPPGTGDIQLSLIESLPLHGALVISTPQDVALIDAHKALTMFETLGVPVIGLVENMSVYHCPSCGHESYIFGEGGGAEFSEERRIRKLTSIPLDPSIRMACDIGQPISLQKSRPQARIFGELAREVIRETGLNTEPN
ncbi:MAG: Mrp/NBP35 family ATP-binding protein [Deltaproteobacteria bacterium]|nr:Mrp/NBP35 family ATP-binding protein [Deltaproteobacteria bacterium]